MNLALPKNSFKRQTLHVLNRIPIWADPNNQLRQLIQTSHIIASHLIAKIKDSLLQMAAIVDQNGGKMWERQILEMKSLFFLRVRSRRVEQVEEDDFKCSQHETTEDGF